MKQKQPVPIQSVYSIFVEEPGDFYFHPRGVLFVDEKLNHSIFCSDVDHNFLMSVIRKFPYDELEAGTEYKGHQFEFKNLTEELIEQFGTHPDAMPKILESLYGTSPRQYGFLAKFLQENSVFGQIHR
jgi:hypothetical protein